MTMGLLPMMIPHFTVLQARGLKRATVAVYGAIVAYDAVQYVPTAAEIAQAAGLSPRHDAREARRALADLVARNLVERVRHTSTMTRYVPLGPKLRQAPANDNGQATERETA